MADEDPAVVVSSDSHVGPAPDQLRPYCPQALRDDFDREVAANARRAALALAQVELAAEGAARRDEPAGEDLFFRNRRTAGHHDVHARLEDMDRDGVTAAVIFHGSQNGQVIPLVDFRCSFQGEVPARANWELEAAGRRIYNRWLADFCAVDPARHVALCQVPVWDLDAAVAEVAWAHGHGFRGVHFPATMTGLPTFEDGSWDPFFALCADLGMVLTTHISGAEHLPPLYTGPGAWGIQAMDAPWLARRPVWLMVFSGVFDRHPGLRLVITEVPGAWWATTSAEMDSAYFSTRSRMALGSGIRRPPSEYLATNVWVGASFQSRQEAQSAVESGYTDRVMWGSDYPHSEGTWAPADDPSDPSVTRLSLAQTFHGIDELAVRRMVGGNAVDCYGLDAAALAEVAAKVGPPMAELAVAPDLRDVPDHYHGCGFRTRGAWS